MQIIIKIKLNLYRLIKWQSNKLRIIAIKIQITDE